MWFLCTVVLSQTNIPVFRFKDHQYVGLTVTGTAFRRGAAHDELLPKLEIQNAADNDVISSEIEDDKPQGTLLSPDFTIQRKYISFRIGGGDYAGTTCIDLLVNGKVVKSATGHRSDRLSPESWEVGRWRGKSAQLRAVDAESGDWGHINVDHIEQTDRPERMPLHKEPLYQESLRPQFHFTARQWTEHRLNPGMRQEGWINDLNGLIYYDGEYHLFAQRWAKCWLHAVSRDLVHWQELEPAFWEESEGSGVQSGTCVVDYANTSGLAKDPKYPAMVAFWSRFDNRSQCISYSLDHGRTWTKYAGNPLFDMPERDPKVFWYQPGKHWVMMMYGDGAYHVLTSPDLLHWTDQHHPIPDSFECPDFFEMPIDGDPHKKKWVLIQGNGNYSFGTFDGTAFHEESTRRPCDLGPNFYATQSWANTETGDGRRIQCAWMRGADFPDMPFNQEISFPCELTLRTTPDGLRLFRKPIKEIELLQETPKVWKDRSLGSGESLPLASKGETFRIKAAVHISEGAKLIFELGGVSVTLTAKSLESGSAPVPAPVAINTIEILMDRGSVEIFLNDGEVSSTGFALPNNTGLNLKTEGGAVQISLLEVFPLKSALKK